MSKYAPLWEAVDKRTEDSFTLTFAEVEQILGFPIDHSVFEFQEGIARLRLAGGQNLFKGADGGLQPCCRLTSGSIFAIISTPIHERRKAMEKFIPFEKLSKKAQQKRNAARRGSWYGLNPVTRKLENSKAYNRRKAQKWSDGSDSVPFAMPWGKAFNLLLCVLLIYFPSVWRRGLRHQMESRLAILSAAFC